MASTYDEYEEKRISNQEANDKQPSEIKQKPDKPTKSKRVSPGKELERKKRRIAKIEQLMEQGEAELKILNEQTESPQVYSDYEKLLEIQQQIDQIQLQQDIYEEEWAQLMEELEWSK